MQVGSLLRSLDYLNEWTNKLMRECKAGTWDLPTFLSENDFVSYWKYYKELLPYVVEYKKTLDNEEVAKLVEEYTVSNMENIERIINEKRSLREFIIAWSNPLLPHRGTDKFEFALNDIANTTSNIMYQIKISLA